MFGLGYHQRVFWNLIRTFNFLNLSQQLGITQKIEQNKIHIGSNSLFLGYVLSNIEQK